MPSKRIIFYTDCFLFGGCEKPIFEITSSQDFLRRYDHLLVYRATSEYIEGMRSDFPDVAGSKLRGVKFPDIHTWHLRIEKRLSGNALLDIYKKTVSALFRVLRPFIFLYEIVFLWSLFLKEKADIVHVNNGGYPGSLSCRAAVLAARCAGVKRVVLGVHNMVRRSCGIFDPIVDFFVRRSVSFVVSVSEASGSALSADMGFDKSKIVNIYNGIKGAGVIKIDPPGRRISMVARFDERKGHALAILALKKLISGHPELNDIKIIFMGEGPLLSEIKGLAAGEGIGQNTIFMGHRSDCLAHVASSLFLINPSLEYESLPYSIIESMSLGIPAIGTSVGGIPEEIEDGVTGIIVPPCDSAALAQAMFSLLSDENKRHTMGEMAKKRFGRLFTLDAMIGNYLALYDKVVS